VRYLSSDRLDFILARIPSLRIAVIGDFFLDRYFVTEPSLAEVSVETGLEARQVVDIRRSPGAAGTVTNNLSALGVGTIDAYGVIGDEGEGYELRRALEQTGVKTERLLAAADRFTPTYMKPMVREGGGERELERLDVKNRTPMAPAVEEEILSSLRAALQSATPPDAVIIADQVQERNCGVITDRVRETLGGLAERYSETLFFADSRVRIGEFVGAVLKPNFVEAARAVNWPDDRKQSMVDASSIGFELARQTGRRVFLTLGEDGMMVCRPLRQLPDHPVVHVPAPFVTGPIDICGAGDSATAGIVCALCAGATSEEAATLGNLCASVTIRKLGTTGTASPEEVLVAARERERPPTAVNEDQVS
jgi:rfaE bifunctional protein kinase chain/domain